MAYEAPAQTTAKAAELNADRIVYIGSDVELVFLDLINSAYVERSRIDYGYHVIEETDPVSGADGYLFQIAEFDETITPLIMGVSPQKKVTDLCLVGEDAIDANKIFHILRWKPPFGKERIWRLPSQLTEKVYVP